MGADNLLEKVGLKCQRDFEVQILKSGAGYYVGTFSDEGPNCRLSQYYGKTKDDPVMNIERDCAENQFCNGNQIGGCKFKSYHQRLKFMNDGKSDPFIIRGTPVNTIPHCPICEKEDQK